MVQDMTSHAPVQGAAASALPLSVLIVPVTILVHFQRPGADFAGPRHKELRRQLQAVVRLPASLSAGICAPHLSSQRWSY